jgi:molybdopterin/thiamine biosynthesis adenylyltransferase
MTELVLASHDFAAIRGKLIGGEVEACAIVYTGQAARTDGSVRLLGREVEFAAPSDYTRQGELEAELSPDFVARVTKRARREGYGLTFVHSHPGDHAPGFSPTDDYGEGRLAGFLAHRHPGAVHGAMVVSAGGVRARQLGKREEMRVISIGARRDVLFDPAPGAQEDQGQFDRQVRAFGAAGQRALGRLSVGIVGLGGTGSIVAQELVHLGVRDFVLIDADVIEESNLNRVAHATSADIGHPKVEVAARYIRSLATDARVKAVKGDIIRSRIARELFETDFILGCTDSHGSRAVLQQVSYQYLIPCIDMGTTIVVADGKVTHIQGRVQLLAPGLACFTCNNLLNAAEVRRDMMTAFERKADPYLQGAREPAPAVISVNGTVASLAVTMLLSVVTGIPGAARHVLYNAIACTLRSVRAQPAENCFVCSPSGAYARGDAWPLNARND